MPYKTEITSLVQDWWQFAFFVGGAFVAFIVGKERQRYKVEDIGRDVIGLKKEFKRAATVCAMVAAMILTTGCVKTTVTGDAGCRSYAEARLAMPRDAALPAGAWGGWIADLDDRMTGTCR